MKMLIVDDDPIYRKVHAGFARQSDVTPVVANDGEEGWSAYLEHSPTFCLLDWIMPRLTGVELCRRIRAHQSSLRPYIIIVTTLSDNERILEGFDAGADDYIAKPCDRRTFESHVRVASQRMRLALKQVEDVQRSVVERYQEDVGLDHPKLLESLSALSDIYRHERSFAKARDFLRRQIAVAKQAGDQAMVRRMEASLAQLMRTEAAEKPEEAASA